MTPEKHRSAALILAAIVFGCEKTPEPEGRPSPVAPSPEEPAPAPAPPPKPKSEAGIRWKDPEGWQRLPKESAMRKATYRVPKAEGDPEDAELAVFHFGPDQGGSVEANVKRWAGQFSDVKEEQIERSQRSAGGLTQHLMEIESGTYSSGMPGGDRTPKAKYGLLAAIVETPSGPYFFKMTGPAKTVASARQAFVGLLDSIRVTER